MIKLPVGNDGWVLIDNDDYDDVKFYDLHAGCSGKRGKYYIYAIHKTTKNRYSLHRIIMNIAKGDNRVVHHLNGNTFDNRKENLMILNSQSEHAKLFKNDKSNFFGG